MKLKNPNFLVSPTRLSVRNIPSTTSEKALKHIFVKAALEGCPGERIQIKQVKILKDKETGEAKGIGFVEFESHPHALAALRGVNNNPEIFVESKEPEVDQIGKPKNRPKNRKEVKKSRVWRPIVEFAIENVQALRKLHKTQERGKPRPDEKPIQAIQTQSKKRKERPKEEKVEVKQKEKNEEKQPKPTKKKFKPEIKLTTPKPSIQSQLNKKAQQRKADPSNSFRKILTDVNEQEYQQKGAGKRRKYEEDNLDDLVTKYKSSFFESAKNSPWSLNE
jgi:nucleolar protein 4